MLLLVQTHDCISSSYVENVRRRNRTLALQLLMEIRCPELLVGIEGIEGLGLYFPELTWSKIFRVAGRSNEKA
jgi:hypothetical protein